MKEVFMKKVIVSIAILLVCALLMAGCTSSSTTSAPPAKTAAPAPTSAAAAPTSAAPAKTTPAADQPQYGGTFIYVRNTGIPNIGAPSDTPASTFVRSIVTPVLE